MMFQLTQHLWADEPSTLSECFDKYKSSLDDKARKLVHYSLKAFGLPAETEDDAVLILEHESYINAASRFHKLSGSYPSFYPWFVGIMRNVINRKKREFFVKQRASITFIHFSLLEDGCSFNNPFEHFCALDWMANEQFTSRNQEVTEYFLSFLNEEERNIITLHYRHEMEEEEIEQLLHLPVGSFERRHYRIIKRLQKIAYRGRGV